MATTACKKGHVRVNNDVVKPGRNIYPMDKIGVRINQINYQLVVQDIPKSRVGAKLVDIYRTDTTPKSEFESQELLKYSKDYYREKGEGRPTKKDRREIDDYLEDNKIATLKINALSLVEKGITSVEEVYALLSD